MFKKFSTKYFNFYNKINFFKLYHNTKTIFLTLIYLSYFYKVNKKICLKFLKDKIKNIKTI